MKLDDYQRADCTLFRQPPVDVSKVTDAIEVILVEAWRKGVNAQNAVDSVVGDNKILTTLAAQIAPNLEFQQTAALEQTAVKAQAAIASYEESKQEKLAEIAQTIGVEKAEKEKEFLAAKEYAEKQYQGYSKAQAELDALRQRAQEKLKEIGGDEGFEKLLKINEVVVGDQAPQQAEEKYVPETPPTETYIQPPDVQTPTYTAAIPLAVPQQTQVQSPLEEKITPIQEPPTKKQKVGFWKKVWKVLNYELW